MFGKISPFNPDGRCAVLWQGRINSQSLRRPDKSIRLNLMKNVVTHAPDPDEELARSGMIAPVPVLLEEGSYIYRFANHTANFGYQAGAWWVLHSDFDMIVARADRAGLDLGQKARWDLAVLHKWGSKMNVAVEARVTARLWAWNGLAKPQLEETANGKMIRMYGNPSIRQLYLCGVVDRFGMLTPHGRNCLSVTGAKQI